MAERKTSFIVEPGDEHDGKTTLTSTTLLQSVEDRDGYIKTGANEGAAETMDRLAKLLGTMSSRRNG